MRFNLPTDKSSIIKVIGVGGGGGNAVNHMFNLGIKGVDFIVCNTDHQALDTSPVPIKIQLGSSLTEGRGAGSIPEIGKNAAIENIDDIRDFLSENTKMVFVTAGMGGGTGTGAAPVIAKVAKELGILTVGIVTMPFSFEGRKRKEQAARGLEEMRQSVDTLLVINNDRLREMYGNLSLQTAFGHADDVLTTAAKGIAEVISVTGAINVDFNDVNTVMKDSGVAIMGQAYSEGEDRAIKAVQTALASPLLNDNDISGAKYVLLNITYGDKEVLMDEISDITDYIQDEAGSTADVIWGHGYDESLGDKLSVTIIATGFNSTPDAGFEKKEPEQKKYNLETDKPKAEEIQKPVQSPVDHSLEYKQLDEAEAEEEPFLKTVEPTPEEPTRTNLDFEVKSPFETDSYQEPRTSAEAAGDTQKEETTSWNEQSVSNDTNNFGKLMNDETPEVRKFSLDDDYQPENTSEATPEASWEQATPKAEEPPMWTAQKKEVDEQAQWEQQKLAEERMKRIKDLSSKLKTPGGISALENEPAYKRREVNLEDVPHSSESNVSKFTLSEDETEDGEKRTGLRENNSFLHDNVD